MNDNKEQQPGKQQPGIDVDKIGFGEGGETTGLDDDVLDSVSGGLSSIPLDDDNNVNCPCTNSCG